MAEQLVAAMTGEFDPRATRTSTARRCSQVIEAKVEGEEIAAPEPAEESTQARRPDEAARGERQGGDRPEDRRVRGAGLGRRREEGARAHRREGRDRAKATARKPSTAKAAEAAADEAEEARPARRRKSACTAPALIPAPTPDAARHARRPEPADDPTSAGPFRANWA